METTVKGRKEIFPIYSWSLFKRIPNEVNDYALRILALGGEKLDPVLYFEEAHQWFPKADSITVYHYVQKLGHAVSRGDAAKIEEIRRLLESVHLDGAGSVRYEVVRRSFDPVDRWKYGRFRSVESLGLFESSEKEQ